MWNIEKQRNGPNQNMPQKSDCRTKVTIKGGAGLGSQMWGAKYRGTHGQWVEGNGCLGCGCGNSSEDACTSESYMMLYSNVPSIKNTIFF